VKRCEKIFWEKRGYWGGKGETTFRGGGQGPTGGDHNRKKLLFECKREGKRKGYYGPKNARARKKREENLLNR